MFNAATAGSMVLAFLFGPGALAGTLAIEFHSVGFVGRLFSEALKNTSPRPIEALRAAGVPAASLITFGYWPQVLPAFWSLVLIRWDINVRKSIVLGLVGAGGVGMALDNALNLFQWTRVAMILLAIPGVVILAEIVVTYIHKMSFEPLAGTLRAEDHPLIMADDNLKRWRKAERGRLIEARLALNAQRLVALREAIDTHLLRAFPGLATSTIAFCWPFQNEYDARHLAHRMRERGAKTALPMVVARGQPLIFRMWKPGDPLAKGVYDIPYPAAGDAIVPDVALVPMNGFDAGAYRLGYGGGFFDRTLAALRAGGATRPVAIGVTYELARMETICPQSYDIPMDYVVTERGVYQRTDDGLVYLDAPRAQAASPGYSSLACLAHEIAPGYIGETDKPASK